MSSAIGYHVGTLGRALALDSEDLNFAPWLSLYHSYVNLDNFLNFSELLLLKQDERCLLYRDSMSISWLVDHVQT